MWIPGWDDLSTYSLSESCYREVYLPHGSKCWISEDLGHYPGSVDRRVGVHGSDQDFDLGIDSICLLLCPTHNGECSGPLTWSKE